MDSWGRFQASFTASLATLRATNRGCRDCTGGCLLAFDGRLGEVRTWRAQFRALDATAQDAHLCFMFHGTSLAAPFLAAAPSDGKPGSSRAARLSTSSSGELPKAKRPKAKRPGSMAPHRATSRQRLSTSSRSGSPLPGRQSTSPSSSSGRPPCDHRSTSPSPAVAGVDRQQAAASSGLKRRRQYNDGQRRRAIRCTEFAGTRVCVAAAKRLAGIGSARLSRIRDGLPDGRRKGFRARGRAAATPKARSVWTFLWQAYHSGGLRGGSFALAGGGLWSRGVTRGGHNPPPKAGSNDK
jgi:hypothetical protein